jgi:DNA polymerase elongation subunit (family B)
VKHLGWILDLYHKPGQMVVWLKKPDGKCVRLTDRWKPRIHVGGDYRDLIDLACKSYVENSIFVNKFERAGDIEKSRVLEVVVENDEEAAKLARRIQRESSYSSFRLYDVDIPSPQIYLYQRDLFPLAFVEADEKDERITWTLRDSRNTIDYELPPLRKIRLEVKTRKSKRIRTFEDELDSIRILTDQGETIILDSGNEEEKLLRLVEVFNEVDPDIVITEGGDSFIFPYLARRAHKNRMLNRLVLGRDPSPLRVYEVQGHSYFSYGKILYRETAARLLGRLHVDDHNAFISADCGLEGLFEISRTCIIPIQRASRATIGTNMTSLQFYHAVKENVLIPWNKNQPEEWKDSNELVIADRGGFIHEPETGIYDQVGELDFTSLFPTIMRDKNISGETIKCKCCPDSTLRVPELNYNICRRPGIVPLSLEIILRRRAEYKRLKKTAQDESTRSKFDQRQSALKWILVCCLSPDSPVLTLQEGRVSYQQIGRIVNKYLGDAIGVVDCPEELFVAGVDNNLKSKFCKVSKLIKVPSPKKLLRIGLEDGRQVKCTSNHSFYVLKDGRLVEKKAENLSRGDFVPVARRVVNEKVVSRINLLENFREKLAVEENDLWRAKSENIRPLVEASSSKLEHVLKEERRPIQNVGVWRKSGIIPFRYLQLLSLSESNSDLLIGRGRKGGGRVAWLPASLSIDEDLGFLLGFYVADGSAGENFIRLDVGGNETEIIKHLTGILKTKFGLLPRIYKESKANMYVVQVNSASLVQVLQRIFELPPSSDTGKLKVPPILFNSSREAMLGFLSGLVAGDGSINKARDYISITTHSYAFAVQLGYFALQLGIPFNILSGSRLHTIYFIGPNGLLPFAKFFLKKKHRTRFETINTSCTADCRHAVFEMLPVEESGLKEIATLARTVRTPRVEGKKRVCPERAKESLRRITESARFPTLQETHSRIEKLLKADIGFVAVKGIKEVETSSPYVYCFQIAEESNLPGFFTGSGGVLVHNCFGYLGFKNARFGKIDAHIATCAFSRVFLHRAVAIAQDRGFKLVHGIVDSMWLTKADATTADYEDLCATIRKDLKLPLSFEGLYRWIVFLNSKTEPEAPVLNRYYGVFQDQDRTLKVRGIDVRRHDTPGIVEKCQTQMLAILKEADNSREFQVLIPQVLNTLRECASRLRSGTVPIEELVITKNLSKMPNEYTHRVPQAIAAQCLIDEGGTVHAGQQVSYVLTIDRSMIPESQALPPELVDDETIYDAERYVDLLVSSTANLLLPFGYDVKSLAASLRQTSQGSPSQDTLPDRISESLEVSMFPPDTTQTTFCLPALPVRAAATDAAPAPSATTRFRSTKRRTAEAISRKEQTILP